MRKAWLSDLHARTRKYSVDRGRTLSKSKKLFKLNSILCNSAQANPVVFAADHESISACVADCFGRRWGSESLSRREALLDFLHSAEGDEPDLRIQDFVIAFHKLHRWENVDKDGMCVLLLWIVFAADPEYFVGQMKSCLAHRASMQCLVAQCKAFGKRGSDSFLQDVRAIVPMSSILRLLDRVLAIVFERQLVPLLPPLPGFFVGAQKYTQALDIGHAAALFVEKALDNHSEGDWAQADILTYFDALPTLRILQ